MGSEKFSKRFAAMAGISVLLTVTGVGSASGAAAAPGDSPAFKPVPAGSKINNLPAGMRDRQVTVMVELSEDPVAVVDAAAAQPLTTTQKKQRRERIRTEQVPVEKKARQLGGTVLGAYQDAYNGIKVRVAADELESLAAAPGVVKVHALQLVKPDNVRGVAMIGAPAVWSAPDNLRGEGVKVAILDTGIDFTHADFGGPGTTAAYEAAHATETTAADPALFGPKAPKVKGGIDLVGDSYDADPASDSYQPVPHPDANPLDCGGHGTHVAGTVGGYGVLADGSTYKGAYDSATINSKSWIVGPGVAPKVDLYAVRVFGCEGSTDMTVDAINWAVANDMDVINMSLGSPFGTADAPESVAADNASKNGVIVVASAGNSGPAPYITGSPASSTSTISVAASDPTPAFPGAKLSLGLNAINANGATFANGLTAPIKVVGNGAGGIALGCSTAEFAAAGVTGSIAVVARGTCARVAKAVYGQAAGAVAVIQVNNVDSLPPYEGPITSNPDTGEAALVTIPFLGVPSSAGATLLAANGSSLSLENINLENPGYKATASFSSGGARTGDSWLKPDVTAPGVSIFSAGVGTGNGTVAMSGTSMAAPMTAGQAALVKQAHPDWRKVEYWKAAMVNTADPSGVSDYTTRVNGAGLIQAPGAVNTQVVALGDKGTATLNYGFAELDKTYSKRKVIKVKNLSRTKQTFTVAATLPAGSPHKVKLSKTKVTLAGKGETEVGVTLEVAAGTAGDSSAFNDVAGLITLTPTGKSNDGVKLRVPYYLVPQAVSKVSTALDVNALKKKGAATATVTNKKGAVAGTADVFAWGLSDAKDAAGAADLKAVGVQSLPADNAIAFAVSTHNRLSNAARNEFDVYVDVNGDKIDDYLVVGADYGLLTTGDLTGELVTAVFDLRTGGATLEFFADAPFDSSTIVLPVLVSQLCEAGSPCLSAASPRLTYHVESVGIIDGNDDEIAGTATFNPFTPALTIGLIGEVAPNKSLTSKVTLDKAEFAKSPAKGLLVLSHDNTSTTEAQLITIR
ncbi:S8 family peptidase [Actinoplanes derwentensis]|uniref:PA domain-containing protein n=1 Tax=Actinoplanes derwentensis TaxID=113562 RepID=A0A1H2CPA5_9ACTN|nr:S8 family serine peptidase [Actinoplanes derwentensis]GID88568.1 peptidase S8 [Actinoplanes derwentensis]SDT72042.1 PA domain-containing protein [Actinoplanes derwentensis]